MYNFILRIWAVLIDMYELYSTMVLVVASINSYQFNLAYALFIYKCVRNFFCEKGVFKTILTKYQRENIILIFWSKSCKEETTHKVIHHFFSDNSLQTSHIHYNNNYTFIFSTHSFKSLFSKHFVSDVKKSKSKTWLLEAN